MNDFYLNGDLCQMATQKTFLCNQGFCVGQTDVYPTIKKSDVKMALTMFWANKVEGWWNYKEALIDNGICTEDEFKRGFK